MHKKTCMFCGQNCGPYPAGSPGTLFPGYDCDEYGCPQCGYYVTTALFSDEFKSEGGDEGFRISCVLGEKRLRREKGASARRKPYLVGISKARGELGDLGNRLHSCWQVSGLLAEFPKATEFMDRSLMNFSLLVHHPMQKIERTWDELHFLLFCPESEAQTAFDFMKEAKLLTKVQLFSGGQAEFVISPVGWKRIEELSRTNKESKQAFVAMWNDPSTGDVYANGIALAIKEAGYDPKLIVTREHNNDICDEIIAEIRHSRFIVADFTAGCCEECDDCKRKEACKTKVRARGGVYFEAGYALGLGIPVIWIVRKEQLGQIHFDTRQYNHIDYKSPEDLKARLLNRIRATIV